MMLRSTLSLWAVIFGDKKNNLAALLYEHEMYAKCKILIWCAEPDKNVMRTLHTAMLFVFLSSSKFNEKYYHIVPFHIWWIEVLAKGTTNRHLFFRHLTPSKADVNWEKFDKIIFLPIRNKREVLSIWSDIFVKNRFALILITLVLSIFSRNRTNHKPE